MKDDNEVDRHIRCAMTALKIAMGLLAVSLVLQVTAILGKAGVFN